MDDWAGVMRRDGDEVESVEDRPDSPDIFL